MANRLIAHGLVFLVVTLVPLAGLGGIEKPAAGDQRDAGFPITRVVIFNTGLAYVEREGRVAGSGDIELTFNERDINDLLKSLIVRDLDGGRITGVRYASRDPLTRILRSFTLDLTGNPGLADLLTQARGQRVEAWAGRRIAGTILGIDVRQREDGLEEAVVNLVTEAGISSLPLSGLESIAFQNERLNSDLQQALLLLADSRRQDRKRVIIGYQGDGTRRLTAAYVREAPVWKTSYRLAVSADGKATIQGWAIVENTSDEDWSGVKLELISGLPLSFVMDLYQPVYNPRPQVAVALPPSVRPQTYDEGIAFSEAAESSGQAAPPSPAAQAERDVAALKSMTGSDLADREPAMDAGVRAVALTDAVGEFFRFTVETPVRLERGRSAMLPILNSGIDVERLSIYNEAVIRKHPLNGLRLTNTTGLTLMAGPITVFEGGIYAGDARIDTLQPGGKRLVSFSVDLETEVLSLDRSLPETITTLRLVRGALLVTRLLRRERTYTIVNRGGAPRDVLVEHPSAGNWKLMEPLKYEERTESGYRFLVPVPGGADKKVDLRIVEERVTDQSVALSNASSDSILFYINQRAAGERLKSSLQRFIALKNDYTEATKARQGVEAETNAIYREQERIRANMGAVDRTSNLYQRYVQILGQQEDRLGELRIRLATFTEAEAAKKKAVDEFLIGLEVP